MGRQPCCDKIGLKKGPWTSEEDKKLINFILTNGQCCWRALPKRAGLLRCGKSCRLRWTNYLRPDLKRGLLSEQEEMLVIQLHSQLGNRWSKIASHLPGRTDNEIKNLWNTHIKKKLKKMGIDHLTHKQLPPSSDLHQSQEKPQHEEMQDQDQELDTEFTTYTNTDDDHQPQENIDQNDNGFCIDEVPLIEPHEIIDLPSSSSSSTSFSTTPPSISNSFSSSNIDTILEDLDIDMGFWNSYNGEEFSNWDISVNDFDKEISFEYGIIQSPPPDLTHYSRMVLDEECRKYINPCDI